MMVVFDLETTGTDIARDRVVQIGLAITDVRGEVLKTREWLINPLMPISPGATEVHGITDEMVADQPTFADIADELFSILRNRVVAGFNSNRFDIPLLIVEFHRVGKSWKPADFRDAYAIEQHITPMSLEAIYKRRTGQDLEGAHDALTDVIATCEVLRQQLGEVGPDMLKTYSRVDQLVDWGGKFRRNDEGEIEFTFGKYRGQIVGSNPDHVGFLEWMLRGDFHPHTLQYARKFIQDIKLAEVKAAPTRVAPPHADNLPF